MIKTRQTIWKYHGVTGMNQISCYGITGAQYVQLTDLSKAMFEWQARALHGWYEAVIVIFYENTDVYILTVGNGITLTEPACNGKKRITNSLVVNYSRGGNVKIYHKTIQLIHPCKIWMLFWNMIFNLVLVISTGCPAMSPHKIPWLFPDISLTILWFSLTMRHIIGISLLP